MKYNILLPLALVIGLLSCKKEEQDNLSAVPGCSVNSGSFSITVNGQTHILQNQHIELYAILYNWYEENENHISISGLDQFGNDLSISGIVKGLLTQGIHMLYETEDSYEEFDIDIGASSYYTSSLSFSILESQFDPQTGMYRPIRGTFTGTAHSYPWSSSQPPADTLPFSGNFCLNGVIFN